MAGIDDIVNQTITSATKQVTQEGFGTLLVVGSNPTFAERIRFYGDAAAAAVDLTPGWPELVAVQAAFAQTPAPTQVAVGKKVAGDATWGAALDAILAADSDWYGLAITSRVAADIEAVAAWTETNKKLFAACSSDAGIIGSGSSDVASLLKTSNYARTFLLYSGSPAEFPEAAWLGRMLPMTPGQSTFKFKTLAGITADAITDTARTNLRAKSANWFETIAGNSITQEGTVAVGEFIDTVIGTDWTYARIGENAFAMFINNEKVPFTHGGGTMIDQSIRSVLRQGVNNQFLTDDPAYTVTVPDPLDVPTNDRTARLWSGIGWSAWLAGAVHKLQMNGRLLV